MKIILRALNRIKRNRAKQQELAAVVNTAEPESVIQIPPLKLDEQATTLPQNEGALEGPAEIGEPIKKTPAKKVPAKKAPAKEAPAKKAPAKKEPAKKAPAKEAPAKKAAAKKSTQKNKPNKK
jgi:hypothetical protein